MAKPTISPALLKWGLSLLGTALGSAAMMLTTDPTLQLVLTNLASVLLGGAHIPRPGDAKAE